MAIACRTCGNQNPDGVSFCQYCGSNLQPAPEGAVGQETVVATPPPYEQRQSSPPQYGQGEGYGQQQGYGAGQYAQPQYGQPYGQQYGAATTQAKDPTTGLLLELIGLFGFAGIGWLWAGETVIGISLLIGYFVFLGIEFLSFFIVIGFCLLPFNLIIPIASGMLLQKRLKERQTLAMGGPRY